MRVAPRERAANQHPDEREGALYHDYGHDPGAQRSSEGGRGKAVQRCLQES